MDHSQENRTRTKPTSNSDLMSSAKVLVDAAKAAYSKDGDKIDKARVAGATADFLGAAKHYGKFEEKSFGKYVDKAESYLQNYHSTTAHVSADGVHHGGGEGNHGHVPSSGGSGGGSSSGGYGEYVKLAQGLLNKEGHGSGEGGGNGHSSSSGGGGGGSGDYIKLAQGLLKKGKHGDGGDGGGHGGSGDYIKLAQGFMKKH